MKIRKLLPLLSVPVATIPMVSCYFEGQRPPFIPNGEIAVRLDCDSKDFILASTTNQWDYIIFNLSPTITAIKTIKLFCNNHSKEMVMGKEWAVITFPDQNWTLLQIVPNDSLDGIIDVEITTSKKVCYDLR